MQSFDEVDNDLKDLRSKLLTATAQLANLNSRYGAVCRELVAIDGEESRAHASALRADIVVARRASVGSSLP